MKKILIVIFALLVLGIGSFLIFYFLNPQDSELNVDESTTILVENEQGYDLVEEHEVFSNFVVNKNDITEFTININEVDIKATDSMLFIADEKIVENIIINRSFAIYGDKVLVMGFDYRDQLYSGLVIYDMYESTFLIQDTVNDKFIDSRYTFVETGILLNTKLVEDEFYIVKNGNHDLCTYEISLDMNVISSVMYLFDVNKKVFYDYEELSNMNLDSYLSSYNLCN